MKITKEMVEEWIGTSNQLNEAIDIIQEISNGDYSVDSLKQDIEEYYEEREEK